MRGSDLSRSEEETFEGRPRPARSKESRKSSCIDQTTLGVSKPQRIFMKKPSRCSKQLFLMTACLTMSAVFTVKAGTENPRSPKRLSPARTTAI